MRLVDADELNKVKFHPLPYTHIVPADLLKCQTEAYKRGWNDAIDAIMESAPTVDAVPVVRCKDCKWWHKQNIGGTCELNIRLASSDNFFCAGGAKMEVEDEQTG